MKPDSPNPWDARPLDVRVGREVDHWPSVHTTYVGPDWQGRTGYGMNVCPCYTTNPGSALALLQEVVEGELSTQWKLHSGAGDAYGCEIVGHPIEWAETPAMATCTALLKYAAIRKDTPPSPLAKQLALAEAAEKAMKRYFPR